MREAKARVRAAAGVCLLLAVGCTGGSGSGTADDPVDAGAGGAADGGDAPATVDAGAESVRRDAGGATTPEEDAGPADGPVLDGLVEEVAGAMCDALLRCCDSMDIEDYFAPHRASPALEELAPRMPPAMALDAESCPGLMADIFDIVPFGDWVRAARDGMVGFDEEAYAECLGALEGASCGDEVREAIFDGTCLAYSPPLGGESQRRMFSRTAGDGEVCRPIRDGIGSTFYGTCDPTTSFCCYEDAEAPERGCTFAYDGDGVAREGTCRAAGGEGESCRALLPFALCRTGLECDDGTCIAPSSDALAVGEACVDDSFSTLGECEDGYCDLLGSGECTAPKADGETCTAGYECESGGCGEGACAELTFCAGA